MNQIKMQEETVQVTNIVKKIKAMSSSITIIHEIQHQSSQSYPSSNQSQRNQPQEHQQQHESGQEPDEVVNSILMSPSSSSSMSQSTFNHKHPSSLSIPLKVVIHDSGTSGDHHPGHPRFSGQSISSRSKWCEEGVNNGTGRVSSTTFWSSSFSPTSYSSPPSPTPSSLPSSLPSETRVSQDFNEWYQGLRIHSVYDLEELDTPEKDKSLKEWVKEQPISVRILDKADRLVLKIAGKNRKLPMCHTFQSIALTVTQIVLSVMLC